MNLLLGAFISGLIFAVGLGLGGMTQPAKVVAFLDIAGNWDPSLAFVMGGAILVYAPLYRLIRRRQTPLFALSFSVPTRADIDPLLLGGAALFGIGWGLGGFCPGPGVVSLASGHAAVVTFVAAMLTGMYMFKLVDNFRIRQAPTRRKATVPV